MKFLKTRFLKSWVSTVALLAVSTVSIAQETPARAPVPVFNYSNVSGLGRYIADSASDEQYALFQRDEDLAVLVSATIFGKEGGYRCVAQVGLTHKVNADNQMPRMPVTIYLGGASDPSFSESQCSAKAVDRALRQMLGKDAKALQVGLDQTLFSGGKRATLKPSDTLMNSNYYGMNSQGSQYINNAMPDWFPKAFDYRAVTIVKRFWKIDADQGQLLCFASIGVSSHAPDGRNSKEPVYENARIIALNSNERAKADQDAECFDPLFDALVKNDIQPDSPLIKAFIDKWPRMAESDLKAPSMKAVKAAVAWQAERDRKQALAREREEARNQRVAQQNQRVAQQNSCTVNCVNGDCVRRWPNGRSERFQAPRKFNPFNSQWEWDTSGC